MTSRSTRDDSPKAADEAAAWFVRLADEAGATGEDWRAFEAWLRASPGNVAAYEKLERLSVEIDALADEIGASLGPNGPGPRSHGRGRGPAATVWGWTAVGGAAAVAAAITVAFWPPDRPAPTQIYETPPGGLRQLALADGTRVRLNAASRLAVRLAHDSRQVEMADGEAAFDVAHDPNRPFVIRVGDRVVKVVGTEFDVRHRSDTLQVTVRRGVVEVSAPGPDPAAVRLSAGQQLNHRRGEQMWQVRRVDPDVAFGWTMDQLVYHDQPLSRVAADIGRRFGTPVRIADAATASQRFTGVIAVESEAVALARLEAFADVKAIRTAEGIVLRRAANP